jgi:hypothetical protein
VSGKDKPEPRPTPGDPGKLTTQPTVKTPPIKYVLKTDMAARVRLSKDKTKDD